MHVRYGQNLKILKNAHTYMSPGRNYSSMFPEGSKKQQLLNIRKNLCFLKAKERNHMKNMYCLETLGTPRINSPD